MTRASTSRVNCISRIEGYEYLKVFPDYSAYRSDFGKASGGAKGPFEHEGVGGRLCGQLAEW